jgi:hypothetical protein
MRGLFQRRPVFCTAYLLVFVVLFAGCAWQLSDALIGAYWSVNPNKPRDFAINPEPGRVESLVGMIKFFANGGSLDSKLLAGTSWPSILRERFGLTLVSAACLFVPLFAGHRIATYAVGFGGLVVLLLWLYLGLALGAAHGSSAGGPRLVQLTLLLILLIAPLFALSCIVIAVFDSMANGLRAGPSQSGQPPTRGEGDA